MYFESFLTCDENKFRSLKVSDTSKTWSFLRQIFGLSRHIAAQCRQSVLNQQSCSQKSENLFFVMRYVNNTRKYVDGYCKILVFL